MNFEEVTQIKTKSQTCSAQFTRSCVRCVKENERKRLNFDEIRRFFFQIQWYFTYILKKQKRTERRQNEVCVIPSLKLYYYCCI